MYHMQSEQVSVEYLRVKQWIISTAINQWDLAATPFFLLLKLKCVSHSVCVCVTQMPISLQKIASFLSVQLSKLPF